MTRLRVRTNLVQMRVHWQLFHEPRRLERNRSAVALQASSPPRSAIRKSGHGSDQDKTRQRWLAAGVPASKRDPAELAAGPKAAPRIGPLETMPKSTTVPIPWFEFLPVGCAAVFQGKTPHPTGGVTHGLHSDQRATRNELPGQTIRERASPARCPSVQSGRSPAGPVGCFDDLANRDGGDR